MNNPIDNIFDTRDLIKYISEIEDDLITDFEKYKGVDIQDISQVDLNDYFFSGYTNVNIEEYKEILEFAEELIKDIGYLPKDFPWWIAIDWDKTSDNMMQDYVEIEFQDKTYLIR